MMSSPNGSAKWSKYGVEDGSLSARQSSAHNVALVYSLQFTLTANHVAAADTQSRLSDYSDPLMWRLKLP